MANASMQALQAHAEKLNQQVAEVNASIKALGDVPDDSPALLEYRKQLRRLNSDLKDVNTTMKDYTRGVKAAGELYRHYAMGNIEDMSIKAIRAGVNGMKKRYDNLKAGGDPGDAEEMRLIEAITTEADVVVKRFKTDYQHVVEEIARGGTVTEQTLKRTRDGLADLMQTAETEAEKNELTNYWQKVVAAIEDVAVENRRLRGEVADREEAMRIANAREHEDSQQKIRDAEQRAAAARQENEELGKNLALHQQQRRELGDKMEVNSIQQRALTDRRDELKAQEKEDRAIRNQRVDDANKELNAARRAAKTQQQAYDEQKQTVEKLRTEVQGLTDDIRKMGEVKAEPKIDTSKLERQLEEAKRDLAEIAEDERKANEALKQFGITTADITDDAKLQAAAEKALKEEEESRLELAKQMLQVRKQIGQEELKDSRIVGSKDTQAFYAKNKGVLDDEYWKSEAGGGSISRMYKYLNDISDDPEAKAEFKEQVGMTVKDAMRVAGQRMREVVQEAMKRGIKIDDALSDFADGYGHGPATKIEEFMREFNETVGDKEDELIKKRREKLDAIADVVYEPGEEMASRDERLRLAKESLKGVGEGYYGSGKPLSESYKEQQAEVTRLESEMKKLSETSQQSAQSSEQLAQKQEQLSQKTAELNQQQDKLNGMVDETVTANQRLAKAEQEQTDARNAQAEAKKHEGEAVKKVEDELRGLTDEQLKNAQAYSHLTEEINADTAAMQRNITTEQEATREADRLRSGSIDKMEQALARLRESNRKLDPTIDKEEWERGERAIGQLTLRLEELKKQSAELRREPVLDMMTQRMQSLGTLSRDALTETKKFWEQMVDGAQKGSTELADYEQHLKSIALEEQARVREQGREAFAFFQREDYRRTNAADTEEQRKALVAYRDALPADATDHIEAINALLEKQAQFVKEAAGEWMSLEKAMELASKAGTDQFAGSAKDIQLATQSLERQRDTIIATIREKRNLGQATKAEEDQLADLTKKLRSLKFEQDNVNMSQEKMRTLIETPANAVNLDELRAAIKRADGQLRQMQQSLGENSSEYKRFAEQVKVAKNTLKDMEGAAKASASAWEKAVSRLKTYVGLYMGFNIFWQKVTGTAGDLLTLSDKMGEVRKTTQMTADQVGRLSDALTKLDTRTSLTGLMEFSSLAGSIGLKTQEDVQGFTEAANMLSVSLPELGNEASRTLMKIADATGDLEKNGNNVRETLERVGSTVIALRANSAAAAGPITDFVSRVGAVGAQAGISIDQIAALGATVDALGGRVEMSATALSRMIPAIRNNTFEVAQAIGLTEKQLKSMSGIDQMVAVFKALRDSVKNFDMTTEEGMNAAADAVEGMLGRSVSMQDVMKQLNQQGARAGIVFGLLSQNVDTLEKQLKTAGEAYQQNTALMEEYNKMNDTAAAKWERLKNTIEEWFVSDKMQRILGDLIDIVRKFADWFGSDGPLATGFKMMIAYAMAMKVEFGAAFMGIGGGLKAIGTAFGSFVNVLATGAAAAVGNLAGMTKGLRGLRMATIGARREWLKMDAAMKANVIGAVITAIGLLVYKLYDMHRASKEAAAEVGRFNQKMSDERKALNSLFEPLNKTNTAQDERLRLINEINSKYSKYLGYMLSETSSAIQLADAHALIAKRIREEAYEKRLLEQENKIKGEHEEDMSSRYGWIVEQAREGARGNADATAIADAIKSYIDKNLGNVENDFYFGSLRRSNDSVKKLENGLNNVLERMVIDGKLTRDGAENLQKVAMQYLDVAKATEVDIEKHTSNLRSDLRGIQGAIQTDLANNLNSLVNNVINSANNIVRQIPGPVSQYLGRPEEQKGGLPSLFGGSQQGGWKAPWQQQQQTTPQVQKAPEGWKPNINKKDPAAVRQLVQDQDALRSGLQGYTGPNREAYESWLIPDKDLAEYRKLMQQQSRGPGGSKHNPYGDYNDRVDPYEQWDANALVARRKEMLERVKALANGADVQAVLSEDKRFMDEATRKGIKDMRDAIAWYNEERLKIQEELDARNLTPTGDWKNPEKGGRSKKKPKTPESEGAIAELDRYYSERKELIEEARANEQMTEAEYNRRLDALEQEHLTKRSELRQTFTSEDKQFIQQFRQWWASVKELDEVSWTAIEAEWIAAWERDRKYNNREAQKDLTAMQAIVVKQLKEIEAIIAKERPFNGITDNLQNNLTKMGLLFKDGVPEDGKFMEENTKRLTFLLKEAENAYSLTFDQLAEDMRKNGLGSWADAIINSENADKEKRALIAQLHEVYDSVQDAIKKEASQVKKQVDIAWNDAILPNGKSMKATYEAAISALGVEQSSVSRANNLIGAGVASERVADKLAIKQLQLQLRMQEHYYNLVRKTGQQRVDDLLREAKLREDEGKTNEAERLRLDAKHAQMSLNLSLAKEETELAKQREEIIARTEESQNRLYTELRSWADLLSSSLQGVMEASHAGDAEYYNERAKLNLTGKGGPGAGTYVVIDDAGTSDATAHYEYLDERQALERQHEIEVQNAQAEAWEKLWDDINMKMSEQITDWVNASLQDAAVKDNTDALLENTRAIYESMGIETGEPKPGQPDVLPTQAQPDKPSTAVEPIVIPGGTTATEAPKVAATDPENTTATNANTAALNTLTQVITGQPVAGSTGMDAATVGAETTATVEGDMSLQKPFFQMSEEEAAAAMEMIRQMWQTYNEGGTEALQMMAEELAAMEGIVLPPWQVTEEGMATAMERMGALWQSYAEQGIAAMQQMSDAMAEMPNKIPDPTQLTEEHAEQAVQNATNMYQGLGEVQVQAQQDVTDTVVEGNKKQEQSTKQKNKQQEQSTKSTYSAMTAAMNMYGTAYQIMSNDNMDTTQKFQMFALQAAGQTAIGMLTTNMLATDAQGKVELPGILGKAASQLGPIAGPIAFAAMSALLGGLMAVAMSSVNKSKSQIAQVTGASVGAGRLSTGMLTYAEGNVNELTDPASLTPGRQYNVDGADGKTYRAKYMGKGAKTHITNGAEFHLVGEAGREAIIDAKTTRLLQMNETGIWRDIQTLYNGGSISGLSTRRRRGGVRAFADGNVGEFEEMADGGTTAVYGTGGANTEQMIASLDRNSAIQEALLERLNQPIYAQNILYGPDGLPNVINKLNKEAQRHGEKYL